MRANQFLSFTDTEIRSQENGQGTIFLCENKNGNNLATLSLGAVNASNYSHFAGVLSATGEGVNPQLRVTGNGTRTVDLSKITLDGFHTLKLGGGAGEDGSAQKITLLAASFDDITKVESDSANDEIILSDTEEASVEIGSRFSAFQGILSSASDSVTHTLILKEATLDLSKPKAMTFGSNFTLSMDNTAAQTLTVTAATFQKLDHSSSSLSMGEEDSIVLSETLNSYTVKSAFAGTLSLAVGANNVTLSGSGRIFGGSGADTITTSNDGNTVVYAAKSDSIKQACDWIKSFGQSDKIDVSLLCATISTQQDAVQEAIDTAVSEVNADRLGVALNAAALANTANNGLMWFSLDEASYVYVEETGSGTTYDAADLVIKITGSDGSAYSSLSEDSFLLS